MSQVVPSDIPSSVPSHMPSGSKPAELSLQKEALEAYDPGVLDKSSSMSKE